jgi:threonine aldolase
MDGARFANAVASLDCCPADISWRAGVDVLSFGATKNGAMAAEAVIFFERQAARDLLVRRKRCGQTVSKMRFISIQLSALIESDAWLRNARNANAQAAALASGLAAIAGVHLVAKVETNQIFVRLPQQLIADFAEWGIHLYRWGSSDSNTVRLVTSFDTQEAQVMSFLQLAQNSARRRQRC